MAAMTTVIDNFVDKIVRLDSDIMISVMMTGRYSSRACRGPGASRLDVLYDACGTRVDPRP